MVEETRNIGLYCIILLTTRISSHSFRKRITLFSSSVTLVYIFHWVLNVSCSAGHRTYFKVDARGSPQIAEVPGRKYIAWSFWCAFEIYGLILVRKCKEFIVLFNRLALYTPQLIPYHNTIILAKSQHFTSTYNFLMLMNENYSCLREL